MNIKCPDPGTNNFCWWNFVFFWTACVRCRHCGASFPAVPGPASQAGLTFPSFSRIAGHWSWHSSIHHNGRRWSSPTTHHAMRDFHFKCQYLFKLKIYFFYHFTICARVSAKYFILVLLRPQRFILPLLGIMYTWHEASLSPWSRVRPDSQNMPVWNIIMEHYKIVPRSQNSNPRIWEAWVKIPCPPGLTFGFPNRALIAPSVFVKI